MTSEIVWSREAASFEGPKPLSAILKRKREPASEIPAAQPGITQEADNYAAGAEEEIQTLANDTVGENMEGIGEEEEEEEAFHPEDDVAYDDNANEAAVAQELDEYEDADAAAEDYDYEEADVNAEEENEYQDYQDEDDDDLEDGDDDFARKVSVMIS
ncbi:Zinc finger C-x8-C-x5-C-x3-H type family protein [Zea mays]|uniref:Zinc finger C-x8-C-x5-C-x3-H type family protein n=1 Tax=Zea mays TaxID=4577 RepID=A0A1D6QA08_MAIZE|nr:Zinc finger C-x8-C-x5-C-x3-H type family protein [Zea mays]